MLIRVTVFLTAFLTHSLCAYAQQPDSAPSRSEGWSISAGGGIIMSPLYPGDDAYGVSLVPSIRLSYEDRFFASVEGGMGYAIIKDDKFEFGPIAQVEFGRNSDGQGPFQIAGADTNDLNGFEDIDTSVSLGGFAIYSAGSMELSVKASKAMSGHKGAKAELTLAYKTKVRGFGPPIILSAGPNVKFADSDYINALFGVTSTQAASTGLATFNGSSGIYAYGASGTAIMPLTKKVSMTGLISYDQLTSDAASSPLVKERGSRNQFFAGVITSYKFKL